MDDEWKRRRDRLVNEIRKSIEIPAQREASRAELDACFIEELGMLVQKTRENVVAAVADLASEVKRHREDIVTAAKSAEVSSRELASLTRALVRATNFYVVLTGGLLVVGVLSLLFRR